MTSAPPDLSNLKNTLARYKGASAWLIPMTFRNGKRLGNNGDDLMFRIFLRVLPELNIELAKDPGEADFVIVPPNGALLQTYQFPEILGERLSAFRHLPLVIFPSSANFPDRDPSFMFGGEKETIWVLRESRSLKHLQGRWGTELGNRGVSLALDHDIVASGNAHIRPIVDPEGRGKRKKVLVAARQDSERSSSTLANGGGAPAQVQPAVLTWAKTQVRHAPTYTALARHFRRASIRAASERLEQRVSRVTEANIASSRASDRVQIDISAPQYATFERYRAELRDAAVVVTDRLHVGLPAAFLGARVFLVEAGYHKLTGVYEQSLQGMPNVRLIPQSDA